LAVEKLPSAIPVPNVNFKQKLVGSQSEWKNQHSANLPTSNPHSDRRNAKGQNRKVRDMEFHDSFKKCTSQQPPMMDAMKLASGVQLYERGNIKYGEKDETSQTRMTRQQYEATKNGSDADGLSSANLGSFKDISSSSATLNAQSINGNSVSNEVIGSEAPAALPRRSLTSGIAPQPPTAPRPEHPAPPPIMRREQMKRVALGSLGQSTRERVRTGTDSRFPACAPAPVLGATMGHGLIPQGSKHEEFYFPHSNIMLSDSERDFRMIESNRVGHGQIVTKNSALARRLFKS